MRIDRDAAAIVGDRDEAVRLHLDFDPAGVAGQRLVHGIVDHLGEQVMQRLLVGAADIHAGTLAHRLQPFQHLDVRRYNRTSALPRGSDFARAALLGACGQDLRAFCEHGFGRSRGGFEQIGLFRRFSWSRIWPWKPYISSEQITCQHYATTGVVTECNAANQGLTASARD